MASLITGAEVTGALSRQWLGPRGRGALLRILEDLNIIGVSWLTSLCSLVLLSGTVLPEWPAGYGAPLFTSLF